MIRWRRNLPAFVAGLLGLGFAGSALAGGEANVYRTIGNLDSRTVVWVVAELHLMFAAFVLGVPIFAVIVELVGTRTGDPRYDKLAHELTRLLSAAFSTTAALGGMLAFLLIGLYPTFMERLGGSVHSSFYIYATLFFAEAFALYLYYYAWDRMQGRTANTPGLKKPAWAATGLLLAGVIGLMMFHGGDTEGPRDEGRAAARRIGLLGEGVTESVEEEADSLYLGALTDEKGWPDRVHEAAEELSGSESDSDGEEPTEEGAHSESESVKITPETITLVTTIAIDTLKNAPKNAPVERVVGLFQRNIDIAKEDARLAGENRAAGISAAHWQVVGWCFLAFLLALAIACWATSTKTFHLYLGLILNLIGISVMMIANSWTSFMMSPSGFNTTTFEFGGTTWGAITNPLWQPLNLHRLLANIVFGGFVASAYAAVKFLGTDDEEERAHYDWMGYIGNFVGILAMIPLPFAGYLLGREIYSYSPIMGNNMMGGAFSWGFIFQAVLIGVLFIGANYYLWIGMERIPGAERYRKFIPWYAVILLICFAVWMTPHNLPLSGAERALMGGAQYHPVLKYLGLMPAKNAVVNLIILTTFFCFLMYRRGNRGELKPISGTGPKATLGIALLSVLALLGWYAWEILHIDLAEISSMEKPENRWVLVVTAGVLGVQMVTAVVATALTWMNRGKLGQAIYFVVTALLVAGFLGVWGFVTMVHANPFLRNLAVVQVLMVVSAMILCGTIDVILLRGAKVIGAIRWGKIPVRSQYVLIIVTISVVQLMGLMGFIRSALREDWHLYGVMQDTSAGAGTPDLAAMSWIVAFITLAFFALVTFVFWLGGLSEKKKSPTRLPGEVGA